MQMSAFKLLADGFVTAPLVEDIYSNWHLFSLNTVRQTYPGTNHPNSESIYLRWGTQQTLEAALCEIEAVDYEPMKMFPYARGLIKATMDLVGGKELGRVMIVNLKPGGMITPHFDGGAYADYYTRYHLVLKSEEGNMFFVGEQGRCGEFVHMMPGELWWFNHKEFHWVNNLSNDDRLHLIMDIK